jgi:predicted dehydrogenase
MLINIESNWNQFADKSSYYCDIHGTKGGAEVNPLRLYKKIDGKYSLQPLLQQLSNYELFRNSYRNEINNFIQILHGLTPEMSSAKESAYILELLEIIKASSVENKEIIIEKEKL